MMCKIKTHHIFYFFHKKFEKYFLSNLIAISKKVCYSINEVKKTTNESEEKIMAKKRHDIGKIATKIMAGVLAALMVVGFAGTLIYYLVSM